jgi:hypothetical protein
MNKEDSNPFSKLRSWAINRASAMHPNLRFIENPLNTETLNTKAQDLMSPVLGPQRTGALIERLNVLEKVDNIRELIPLLTA